MTDTTFDHIDDAGDAFLKLFADKGAETLPENEDEEKKEQTTEEPEGSTEDAEKPSEDETEETSDTDEETNDEQETEKPKAKEALDDTAIVKVKVGDKDHEVKVSELKRLYGQEAALTNKSMEVANQRKEIESLGAKHVAASEMLLNKALERFTPYQGIDWAIAVKELPIEQYKALRESAQQAYSEVEFLKTGLDGYMAQVTAHRSNELINEAKATLKELGDPDKGIPGFNQKVYEDMRTFAMSNGIPEAMINNMVSAPALRILHMAMSFANGKKTVTTAKPVTKGAPKVILKSKNSSEQTRAVTQAKSTALSKLQSSGSVDDAEAAFLERFADKD